MTFQEFHLTLAHPGPAGRQLRAFIRKSLIHTSCVFIALDVSGALFLHSLESIGAVCGKTGGFFAVVACYFEERA